MRRRQGRTAALVLAFLLLFLLAAPAAFAETVRESVPREWGQIVDQAPLTADEFQELSFSELLGLLGDSIQEAAASPLALLAKLCGLLVLTGAARSLCAEKQAGLASLLDVVVTLSAFLLCSGSLLGLMETLQQAIESSRTYLTAFIPVFASVLTACGQAGSALIYTGMFFTGTSLIANLLCGVGFPLTRACMAFCAAGCACDIIDLPKLAKLLCRSVKWLLTVCSTAFTMLMTLQGVFAQSADSAALKTGKLLIGSSVPVVGKAVSDAMGSVLAGMKVLKGSVGFAMIAVIAAAFLPLVLQCVVYRMVFAAGELASGAIGSKKCEALFSGLAECVGLCLSMSFFFAFVVIAATMLMIFLGTGG